jgi:hypothetical protein
LIVKSTTSGTPEVALSDKYHWLSQTLSKPDDEAIFRSGQACGEVKLLGAENDEASAGLADAASYAGV